MKTLVLIILLLVSPGIVQATDSPINLPSAKLSKDDFDRLEEALNKKKESDILQAISIILSKDDKNLKALNLLGVYHHSKNNPGLARLIFERALESHPTEPALHNNLAVLALEEGDTRKAILSFKKAISFKSNHKYATSNLSSIYLEYKQYDLARSPLEDAYEDVRRDLSRGSNAAAEVASNYAIALLGVGEAKKSKAVFEKIMDGKSRNVNVMLNYAILLVRVLKEKKEAIKILSKIKFVSEDRGILKVVSDLEDELDKNG